MLTDANFSDYAKPLALKRFNEIEPDIKYLVKSEVEKNDRLISRLSTLLDRETFKINYDEWKDDDFETAAARLFEQHIEFHIDKKLNLPERVSLKAVYPTEASPSFKAGLDAYILRKKEKILSSAKFCFGYDCYTQEETESILRKAWEKASKQFEELKGNSTLTSYYSNYVDDYKKFSESIGKTFKEVDPYSLLHFTDRLSELHGLLKEGRPSEEKEILLCSDPLCREGIKSHLQSKKFYDHFSRLKNLNSYDTLVEEKLLFCRSQLASKNLNDSGVESFKKLIEDAKIKLLERATKGYSEHSKKELKKYLDQLKASLNDVGETEEDFISNIKNLVKNSRAGLGRPNVSNHAQDFIELLTLEKDGGRLDPLGGNQFCESLFSTAWDAFDNKNRGEDTLIVSHFSCTHHGEGKQVVAHELGHALGHAFFKGLLSKSSYESFLDLRSCANSHHKTESLYKANPDSSHPGDKFLTEEDTADLISYLTYPKEELYSCGLLDTSRDGTRYLRLSVKNYDEKDSHSSGLFRLLKEAIHKKRKLPKSCKKVMEENPEFGFKACF